MIVKQTFNKLSVEGKLIKLIKVIYKKPTTSYFMIKYKSTLLQVYKNDGSMAVLSFLVIFWSSQVKNCDFYCFIGWHYGPQTEKICILPQFFATFLHEVSKGNIYTKSSQKGKESSILLTITIRPRISKQNILVN